MLSLKQKLSLIGSSKDLQRNLMYVGLGTVGLSIISFGSGMFTPLIPGGGAIFAALLIITQRPKVIQPTQPAVKAQVSPMKVGVAVPRKTIPLPQRVGAIPQRTEPAPNKKPLVRYLAQIIVADVQWLFHHKATKAEKSKKKQDEEAYQQFMELAMRGKV